MNHPALQQYNYHKWANNRILNRLLELPDEAYNQQINSVFSSLQQVITHIYQADGMWLSVMKGDEFSETIQIIKQLREKFDGCDLAGIQKLYLEMNEEYLEFLTNHDTLDHKLSITHPKFGNLKASVTDMVKHVVNHGTYHRGNITAMLRQMGHAGTPTDYIIYLYESE